MAYYDALIAKWPSVTGATTAAKLANLNSQTVTGSAVPMVIPTYKIYNLIVGSEFSALTAANQQLIRDILGMGTVDCSPGTQIRARIVAIFPSGTTTFSNLSTLAAEYDSPQIPWWQANGYTSTISNNDLIAAGGLT